MLLHAESSEVLLGRTPRITTDFVTIAEQSLVNILVRAWRSAGWELDVIVFVRADTVAAQNATVLERKLQHRLVDLARSVRVRRFPSRSVTRERLLDRLYLGTADGMSIARVWAWRYSKRPPRRGGRFEYRHGNGHAVGNAKTEPI